MTIKEIKVHGYKRYESDVKGKCCNCLYKKLFSDEEGKKYYIDIYEWDFSKYERSSQGPRYEAEVQMELPSGTVELSFFCEWALDDVEEFVERFWEENEAKYYEKYY